MTEKRRGPQYMTEKRAIEKYILFSILCKLQASKMPEADDDAPGIVAEAPPAAPSMIRLLMLGAVAYYGMNYYNANKAKAAAPKVGAMEPRLGGDEFVLEDEFGNALEDEFGNALPAAAAATTGDFERSPASATPVVGSNDGINPTTTGYDLLDKRLAEVQSYFDSRRDEGTIVKVRLCTHTAGFVDRYKAMLAAVEAEFDPETVKFVGEKFPPQGSARIISSTLNVLWMGGLAFSLLGERLITMLGLTSVLGEELVASLVGKKMYIVGALFMANSASTFLGKTGAFELTIDGEPIHSTLANGRLLTASELVTALRVLGFVPAAGGSSGGSAAIEGSTFVESESFDDAADGFDDEFA